MEQNILTTFLLPAALFIIMLGMGLALQIADFKKIIAYPKAIFIGITNQMVLLPIIGFTIATVFNLEPELAVGLMILAACPGGVTSNLYSHLSNGDTALSVTLTAISSTISIITIPLIVNFGLMQFMQESQEIHLPVVKTIVQIMVITIIPIGLGMLIRFKRPDFASKMGKTVKVASAIILFVIVLGVIGVERERIPGYFERVGAAVVLLNIFTMAVGFYSAKLGNLSLPQSITISLESGLQNGTLGIVVAISILYNTEMSVPAAVYSLIMFITGGFMVWRFGRKKERVKK
ncbi:Sodium-dependent transporter [hydrothermal vent metagenome]|uniref:Sodium-dependent transporter n=1 Tax=hydrothermal vent metagenome TaxID=652676 RepID=A0A3B0USG3_9ZZZZ